MNGFLDDFLVGLVLMISAGYAVFSLGPRSLRSRAFAALNLLMSRAPAFPGLGRISGWLAASADKSPGACGGCDNCGSEKTSAAALDATATLATAASASEVRVPLANIGRRLGAAGGKADATTSRTSASASNRP